MLCCTSIGLVSRLQAYAYEDKGVQLATPEAGKWARWNSAAASCVARAEVGFRSRVLTYQLGWSDVQVRQRGQSKAVDQQQQRLRSLSHCLEQVHHRKERPSLRAACSSLLPAVC